MPDCLMWCYILYRFIIWSISTLHAMAMSINKHVNCIASYRIESFPQFVHSTSLAFFLCADPDGSGVETARGSKTRKPNSTRMTNLRIRCEQISEERSTFRVHITVALQAGTWHQCVAMFWLVHAMICSAPMRKMLEMGASRAQGMY